jgi:hypothetical protein
MDDPKLQPGRGLVIDLNLNRILVALLALGCLGVLVLVSLTWGSREAAAAGSEKPAEVTAGKRQFYLTQLNHLPTAAMTACAEGFHFASLWEILDPANLAYNQDLGLSLPEGYEGPTTAVGWIRTGYADHGGNTPGKANCDGWSSYSGSSYGTRVQLDPSWDSPFGFHVWDTSTRDCSWDELVWCVED